MTNALTEFSTRRTPQSEPTNERQVRNSAGGYTFQIDPQSRLRRFLMLGSDGATYYTEAPELTRQNAQSVVQMAEADHRTLVDTIVEISTSGRAPKANPAIFALALASSIGSADEKRYALSQLPKVARTGTHLFLFAQYVEQFRGWGRGLRTAVADWYAMKDTKGLAYQMVKYRQRNGWSHRDLLRLSHPEPPALSHKAMFEWATKGNVGEHTPRLIEGFLKAQEPKADIPALVRDYGLTWEMLPSETLNRMSTWEALLDAGVPQTALMRQLPRLTNLGMLPDSGGWTTRVVQQLIDPERLRKARVHPVNILVAQRTYASGHSARGSMEWSPSRRVVDALDEAFYASFGSVEPSGKRTLVALDVSGSMTASISNMPITCREASAAMAMATVRAEPDVEVVAFTSGSGGSWMRDAELKRLSISPRQRLDDILLKISRMNFGHTDCSLPMTWAQQHHREFDAIQIWTDNETWAGKIHPHQALESYRQSSGLDVSLAVVAMTSTGFSIADPDDPRQLDVVGFDSAVPNLLSAHARGF